MKIDILGFLKRIVTVPKASRLAVQHLVSAEIDSIFTHNPPEAVIGKISTWLLGTPLGKNALGELAFSLALPPLQDILNNNSSDVAREKIKQWIYGRLGVN